MEDVLQSIQNRLEEISELRYIDEDWGQLDNYSPHPPTTWPLALIDLTSANYSNLGVDIRANPINRQNSNETVTITVANVKLANTSFKAPQGQKDKAWAVWGIIKKVHEKLHGWSPMEQSGKLIRTGRQRVMRDDGIQEYRITYTLALTDV